MVESAAGVGPAAVGSSRVDHADGGALPEAAGDPAGQVGAGRDPGEAPAGGLPPRRFGLLLALAVVILAADLVTKIVAVSTLTPGVSQRVLGGVVYFSLLRNSGAAFSMATGSTWILALVAVGVIVMIIRIATRLRSGWWAVALGLILGGALGNLTDRIFRSPGFFRGHVVDFVSVFGPDAKYFPVFNVADSAISVGGVLLVLTALRGIDFDGSSSRTRKRVETGG